MSNEKNKPNVPTKPQPSTPKPEIPSLPRDRVEKGEDKTPKKNFG